MLELNKNWAYAVGVHLDPGQVSIALLDFSGSLIDSELTPLTPTDVPQHTLETIAHNIRSLAARAQIPWHKVVGIGVAVPGPIDHSQGLMVTPPLLPQWKSATVVETLSTELNKTVVLEKDITALAAAELWVANPEQSAECAYFYLGTGIGVGLSSQGRPLVGARRNAGETGDLIIRCDNDGKTITLSDATTPTRIIQRAIEQGILSTETDSTSITSQIQAHEMIARQAESGNVAATALIKQFMSDLAQGIGVVCNLLDSNRVVIGGPFWQPLKAQGLPLLKSILPTVLAHPDVQQVIIDDSREGYQVVAIGAACLALDHTYSPTLERLLGA